MTKKELQAMAAEVQRRIGGKSTHVHVGTWMDRAGVSLEIRMQSSPMGERVHVFKYDDERGCRVSLIKGDGRRQDTFQRFWQVEGVPFNYAAIIGAVRAAS